MASISVRSGAEVGEQFQRLAALWREAAPFHPSLPVSYEHPAYQAILELGLAVVPWLLRDLADSHRHWYWALHVITGADPVQPEARGSLTGMTEAWLRWGRDNGYLPAPDEGAGQGPPRTAGGHETGPREGVEATFQQLAAIWRAETGYLSSITAMVNHPAYQEIIRLGPDVVPLLLQDLERKPGPWSAALRALTGANPIEPADRGKVDRIAEAWLRWGKANGYSW
jgi:hypothetical protein